MCYCDKTISKPGKLQTDKRFSVKNNEPTQVATITNRMLGTKAIHSLIVGFSENLKSNCEISTGILCCFVQQTEHFQGNCQNTTFLDLFGKKKRKQKLHKSSMVVIWVKWTMKNMRLDKIYRAYSTRFAASTRENNTQLRKQNSVKIGAKKRKGLKNIVINQLLTKRKSFSRFGYFYQIDHFKQFTSLSFLLKTTEMICRLLHWPVYGIQNFR
ncbi:hypothetical protein BY458DRAFT_487954 [Sporodiniella umbellata]|nr:hypothetical protein BY458DRAFT_487954 [Sporodiniella umbellata]